MISNGDGKRLSHKKEAIPPAKIGSFFAKSVTKIIMLQHSVCIVGSRSVTIAANLGMKKRIADSRIQIKQILPKRMMQKKKFYFLLGYQI